MFVIEAYCTLRDRGPMPAHQVLKDLEGDFGFVIYDHKAGVVFAANVSLDSSLNFNDAASLLCNVFWSM